MGDKMEFSDEEKHEMLRAFTNLLKDANGKGPKNIYIKYLKHEVHIVMQGVVSDFEKHLIKNFGNEAIKVFTDFYERDSFHSEIRFLEILNHKYKFKFYKLDSDFENDLFVYKMKII
ncbi:Na-translocating system protein MpsC family protein [Fusibacter bizertensis]|uniref:Na-translocating system protein MpsC family protein n=1 Tax=Fusibacter bizertensis TaxID=1488331 RepID=A0ABT6NAG0_9FIRM|nr:Na-translocating system protein MpsC family protein [Fusibacter bizertensis]MDH8677401.1 Na-translocating system protein MpsC family protein [Fusibacter bizertensis]